VIVSAPAPAALHVPVVSLAPSLDVKDPNASKTTPFRNVFDSLTFLDDLQHEGGAQQEGAAVKNSSTKNSSAKKEGPEHPGPGTEELVVPQTQSPSLPKPPLMLPQSAQGATTVTHAPADEATVLPPTSSSVQSDVKGAVTVTSLPEAPAAFLPYTPQTSNTVRLAVTTLPPAKQQVTTRLSTAPSPTQPELAQQPASSTNQTESTLLAIATPQPTAKPSATSSVSMPLPAKAEPGEDEAARLPIRASAPSTPQSTSLATETPVTPSVPAPQNSTVETAAAALKAPVGSSSPIAEQLPASNSSEAVVPAAPSKPAERLSAANAPAASPDQTPGPVEIAAPAPQPSDAIAAVAKITPADPSVLPPSTVSFVEKEPLAPLPADHDVVDRSAQPEPLVATPAPNIPLLPQAENFAFAARIQPSSSDNSPATQSAPVSTNETPLTQSKTPVAPPESSDSQQPAAPVSQMSSNLGRQTGPAAPETEKSEVVAQNLSYALGPQPTLGVTQHWSDAAVWQAPDLGSMPGMPEPAETAPASLPLAAQEAHLLAPDLPKTSASSEILLHLTGNDQSAAAIRVTDRAGSVNVSVHASDPVLRESLRSNLGELSTQLNGQGWKADITKSAVAAMQSGGPQDSHEDGKRGSQPQQSFGGDRQPQRDRRANGGQWQQELDQQISGGEAHSGGNE
jgi:hypothetical protein